MNTLYSPGDVEQIIERIWKIDGSSCAVWGKMNSAQMLAHCTISLETALGKNTIKPLLIGRIISPLLRKNVLGPKPFSKNSPTDKSYMLTEDRDIETEREKVISAIKEFSMGGPGKCTSHPHPFFGKFSPEEWAIFQWKHLDHHLRQFGA